METVVTTSKDLTASRRAIAQSAKIAIRDVYDALAELITNSDDRYQHLGCTGTVEIDVTRKRDKDLCRVQVRDFADGMTAATMNKKLSKLGGRVSGLESGQDVRGTNSRGAKDIAALGHVRFDSIAEDGNYHSCEITPSMRFKLHPSMPATPAVREALGIKAGTGTVVTIQVESHHRMPQHASLLSNLGRLVMLRDIIADPKREIVLRDLRSKRSDRVRPVVVDGRDRVKETFSIPGYPGVTAKLAIKRAAKPFENEKSRFRRGGIVVKSRHAVHEATLFDNALDRNRHARRFYGRLVCRHIDDLSNEFDERFANELEPKPENPVPIVDPSRRAGLTRSHPFIKALFGEALMRLRPLVEEERLREERTRVTIESRDTRKRLDALERAALDFMKEFGDPDDVSREPERERVGSQLKKQGYSVSPPFCQLITGHSKRYWLYVHQETFPEFQVGDTVEIECLTDEIETDRRFSALEEHPTQEGILRAGWRVTAVKATPATGLKVRSGSIMVEASVEVLETEADRYTHITALAFQRKVYRIKTGTKRKKVRILAPISDVPSPQPLIIDQSELGPDISVSGDPVLIPDAKLGVSVCELQLRAGDSESRGRLVARLGDEEATTEVRSVQPAGAGLKFTVKDIDLVNQRSRWTKNVLEIAARHPALRRYLGDRDAGYPGQESKHVRLIIAEIVSEAVCAQMLGRQIDDYPEEWEDADWDMHYSEYTKLMTAFLPIAHKIQWLADDD